MRSERTIKLFWRNENLIKLHIMKTVEELNKNKVPIVRIDPSLEQYRNKVLFPEKLAKANEMLKTTNFPFNKKHP